LLEHNSISPSLHDHDHNPNRYRNLLHFFVVMATGQNISLFVITMLKFFTKLYLPPVLIGLQ